MRYFVVPLFAVVLLSLAPSAQANDPAMCLKACIDQNGADQKKSCAVQCGYGSGASGPGVILNLIQDPRLIIRPHPTSPHNDGS